MYRWISHQATPEAYTWEPWPYISRSNGMPSRSHSVFCKSKAPQQLLLAPNDHLHASRRYPTPPAKTQLQVGFSSPITILIEPLICQPLLESAFDPHKEPLRIRDTSTSSRSKTQVRHSSCTILEQASVLQAHLAK